MEARDRKVFLTYVLKPKKLEMYESESYLMSHCHPLSLSDLNPPCLFVFFLSRSYSYNIEIYEIVVNVDYKLLNSTV